MSAYQAARAEATDYLVEADLHLARTGRLPSIPLPADTLRALLAGPPEPSVGDPVAWQPIESAPTDGRSVLVFCPRASDHGYERIRLTWQKDGKWQGANNTSWPPTHWMPLPPAPKPDE